MYQAMRETRPHRRAIPAERDSGDTGAGGGEGPPGSRRRARGARRPPEIGAHARARAVVRAGSRTARSTCCAWWRAVCSDRDVATRLKISPRNVGQALGHAYEKIGVTTRAGAAMFAMKNGIVGAV